jgi:hypothetical protein
MINIIAGNNPPAWLDLAYNQLTAANVRAKAEAKGLSLRVVMRL